MYLDKILLIKEYLSIKIKAQKPIVQISILMEIISQ